MWVTYGRTESGDDLALIGWDHDPTIDEVNDAYRKLYPIEYEEVGWVSWNIGTLIMSTEVKAFQYD